MSRRPRIGELDISDDGSRVVVGAAGRHRRGRQPLLASLHEHRRRRPAPSTWRPGHQRRALRRDDRRRHHGLLHDRRQTQPRRHRHQRRHLPRRRRLPSSVTLTRVSTGTRRRRHRRLRPGPGKEGPHWNAVAGAGQLRRGRLRRRRRGGLRRTGRSTSSPPRNSTARDARTSRTCSSPRPAARPTSSPRSDADRADDDQRRSATARSTSFGDFQVTPSGAFAVFASNLAADRLPQRRPQRDLPLRRRSRAARLRLLRAHRRGRHGRRDALASGLNLTDDGSVFFTASEPLVAARHEREAGRLRVEGRRPSQLISTGTSDFDSGLLSASADGRQRLLLHPRDARPAGPKRQPMKIYDARANGGFPCHPAAGPPARPPTSATARAPRPRRRRLIGTFRAPAASGAAAKKAARRGKRRAPRKRKRTARHHRHATPRMSGRR